MSTSSSAIKSKIFNDIDHANHISDKLQKFYHEKKYFNITLIAGIDNVKAEAHRIVLCASSEYFRDMFDNIPEEDETDELILENMNGSTLKLILDFMYTASIEFRTDTVENLLRAAKLFKVNTLIAASYDFMDSLELGPNNCLGVAFFAHQHGYKELYKKSLALAYKHFENVCIGQDFLRLDEGQLNTFLSGDDLHIASQEKLFNSLVAWYKHDEAEREELICSLLLQHVRFALLDPKFIVDGRKKLSNIIECSELMWSWLEWHFSSTSPKGKKIFLGFEDNLSIQSFDPDLNKWSDECMPALSVARNVYSMTVINGKCIIAGGVINYSVTNQVEYLDLQSKKWHKLPPMETGRMGHKMTGIYGDLYVVGGFNDRKNVSSMTKFDFSTKRWTNLAHLPSELHYFNLAVLNGQLYIAAADKCYLECYDPANNRWTQTSSKSDKSSQFGMAGVGRFLYIVGGEYTSGDKSYTLERYDPSNNTWMVLKPLEKARSNICCTAWNDRILACAGWDADGLTNIFEEYNPRTDEWKSLASFSTSSGSFIPHLWIF